MIEIFFCILSIYCIFWNLESLGHDCRIFRPRLVSRGRNPLQNVSPKIVRTPRQAKESMEKRTGRALKRLHLSGAKQGGVEEGEGGHCSAVEQYGLMITIISARTKLGKIYYFYISSRFSSI